MKAEIIWGYNLQGEVVICGVEMLDNGSEEERDFFDAIKPQERYVSLFRQSILEIKLVVVANNTERR